MQKTEQQNPGEKIKEEEEEMKTKNKRGKKEVLTEDSTERRSQLGVAKVRTTDNKNKKYACYCKK